MKFRRQNTLRNRRPLIDDDQRRYMDIVCPISGCASPVQEGLEAYVNYIGDQMLQYEKSSRYMLDAIMVAPADTSLKEGRMFDISATIATLLQTALTADPQTSMDSVVSALFEHYGIRREDARKFDLEACQMTFATLGWTSMFFKPIAGGQESVFRGQNSRVIQRPISAMLRALNALPVLCGIDTSSLSTEPVLLVSSISYNTLHYVGHINIIWIDDLREHCDFVPSKRQLKLFRWPSFCVQAYEQSDASLLNMFVDS
jgi:hypothetical protein